MPNYKWQENMEHVWVGETKTPGGMRRTRHPHFATRADAEAAFEEQGYKVAPRKGHLPPYDYEYDRRPEVFLVQYHRATEGVGSYATD